MILRAALSALFVPLFDDDGRAMYSVKREGWPVIEPSQLGFLLADAPKLDHNVTRSSTQTRRQALQFSKDVPTQTEFGPTFVGELGRRSPLRPNGGVTYE